MARQRSRVQDILDRLVADVREELPGFRVRFAWNAAAGDPDRRGSVPGCRLGCQVRRAFAWCRRAPRGGGLWIEAAPRLEEQGDDRIEAVMRHEVAHAVQFYTRLPDAEHTERGTDVLAERLWGDRISYDEDLVQTLGEGVHPRPAFLGM